MAEKFKVLVIDDDPDDVELIKMALAGEPYEISVAYDGKEGVQKAKEENPDAIVLDVMMPEQDGFKACKELKADPKCSDIPVLMLTAVGQHFSSTKYAVGSGMQIEAEDYIEKPVDGAMLQERLAHHLHRE
jgi:two-component system alkaline phosphatase synthesis response regulator PhoP